MNMNAQTRPASPARRNRRMTGVLAAGLAALVLAARTADADRSRRSPRPRAKPAGLSSARTLAQYLTAPLFQFSPTKDGVNRRNPFLIPLTKIEIDKHGTGPVTGAVYRELVAAEEARLAKLRADLKALQAAVAANNGPAILRLHQCLETGLEPEFVRQTATLERDRLRAEFEALRPRTRTVLAAAALASARQKAAAIQAAFAQERHEEVVQFAADFDKLSAIDGAKATPAWKTLAAQVVALARRSRARIDFKSKAISVTSLMVSRSGGVAVINGVTCANGSRLDQDTIVAGISAEAIVFVYRGERIEYRMGAR